MLIFALTILADMVKLVDMPDLGSGAARRVGSSPIIRTKKASHSRSFFFYYNVEMNFTISIILFSSFKENLLSLR